MLLALTGNSWTQIIVALSIFVPVVVASVLAVWVLRGGRHDPDVQRWKRQRLEAEKLAGRVDVDE